MAINILDTSHNALLGPLLAELIVMANTSPFRQSS
jgi:hypothetical protein